MLKAEHIPGKINSIAVLYVFRVDSAAEALISEFSSRCKFSIDGLEFLLARALLLDTEL
jgi:ABC-type transporter Mla MlaB component